MPTATESARTVPKNGALTDETSTLNLHQRIAAIKKAAQVKLTGTTGEKRGDRAAMSIADLDRAIGELMAEHGVHSTYDFLDEPTSYDEKTRDGTMRVWVVHLRGYLVNVDNPPRRDENFHLVGGDFDSAELYDHGTNVSGSVSFALKRWQREVFKLAEDDTSAQIHQRDGAQSTGSGSREDRPLCPECKNERLLRSKPRNDEEKAHPEALGWFCWKNEERGKHGCGARFKADDPRLIGEGDPTPVSVGNTSATPLGPDELDPEVKVCPNCGRAETLRRDPENRLQAYCKNDGGFHGCGAEFSADSVPTRGEYIEKMVPAGDAEAGMTTESEDGTSLL